MDEFLAYVLAYLRGSWVELGSFFVALAYGKATCARKQNQAFISKATSLSILHGLAVFPLMLLVGASFLPIALDALLHSHKIILSGAGLVALFSMLEA
jgi:hypothetical protein